MLDVEWPPYGASGCEPQASATSFREPALEMEPSSTNMAFRGLTPEAGTKSEPRVSVVALESPAHRPGPPSALRSCSGSIPSAPTGSPTLALHRVTPGMARLRAAGGRAARSRSRCLGLEFDGPIGLAAGFDKGDASRRRAVRARLLARRDRDHHAAAAARERAAAPLPARSSTAPSSTAWGSTTRARRRARGRLAALPPAARLGPVGRERRQEQDDAERGRGGRLPRLHRPAPPVRRLPRRQHLLPEHAGAAPAPGARRSSTRSCAPASARLRERAPGKPLLVKLAPGPRAGGARRGGGRGDRGGRGRASSRRTPRCRAPGSSATRARRRRAGSPARRSSRSRRASCGAATRARPGRVPIVGCGGVMGRRGRVREDPRGRGARAGLHGPHLRRAGLRPPA